MRPEQSIGQRPERTIDTLLFESPYQEREP